jgi:hypothetical protein
LNTRSEGSLKCLLSPKIKCSVGSKNAFLNGLLLFLGVQWGKCGF